MSKHDAAGIGLAREAKGAQTTEAPVEVDDDEMKAPKLRVEADYRDGFHVGALVDDDDRAVWRCRHQSHHGKGAALNCARGELNRRKRAGRAA